MQTRPCTSAISAPSPARLRTSGSKKPLDPDWSRLAPEAPGSGYATGLTAIGIDPGIRARGRNGGGERIVGPWTATSKLVPGPDAAHRTPPEAESRPIRRGACGPTSRSEEHTSELQSQSNIVCRLLLE